jgi:SAM-dependent methyltransferase
MRSLEPAYKRGILDIDRRIASIVSRRYMHGRSVIDIGCSYGNMLQSFRELGYEVKGVDNDPDAMEECKRRKLPCVRADIERGLPLPDGSADNIFCSHIMEHVRDVPGLMKQCFRILKPGGVLIIVSPDWRRFYRRYYDDPTHVTPLTTVNTERMLDSSGFTVLETRPFRKPEWIKLIWRYFDFPFFAGNDFFLCAARKP